MTGLPPGPAFFFLTREKKEAKKNDRGAPGVSPCPERAQGPLLDLCTGRKQLPGVLALFSRWEGVSKLRIFHGFHKENL